MVVSLAFYGMSTFEGPMMSIKVVNSLSHYTDWTISHVHSGALGWVAYVSFEALYCLVPWLWNRREVYSLKLCGRLALLGVDSRHRPLHHLDVGGGHHARPHVARLHCLPANLKRYSFAGPSRQPYYLIRASAACSSSSGRSSWPTSPTILGREAEEAEHRLTPALAPAE